MWKQIGILISICASAPCLANTSECPITISMPDLMRIADTPEKTTVAVRGGEWTLKQNGIKNSEKFARNAQNQLQPIIIQTAFKETNSPGKVECPYDIYNSGQKLGRVVLSKPLKTM